YRRRGDPAHPAIPCVGSGKPPRGNSPPSRLRHRSQTDTFGREEHPFATYVWDSGLAGDDEEPLLRDLDGVPRLRQAPQHVEVGHHGEAGDIPGNVGEVFDHRLDIGEAHRALPLPRRLDRQILTFDPVAAGLELLAQIPQSAAEEITELLGLRPVDLLSEEE